MLNTLGREAETVVVEKEQKAEEVGLEPTQPRGLDAVAGRCITYSATPPGGHNTPGASCPL